MKFIFSALKWILVVYVALCVVVYFFQERLMFFPERLKANYRFSFPVAFEEIYIPSSGGHTMHGILFRAEHPKGLIFYLHGNAGSLAGWGEVARYYTALGYSVFMPDYPGYGKSTGKIHSKAALLRDMQTAYDRMKQQFDEDQITVLGYSLGSGPAAWLAARNSPQRLILQAPFYSVKDLMRRYYPIFPGFLLKYNFETHRYLQETKAPVIIFHGDRDNVVYFGSSLKLKEKMKPGDQLITLHGQGHNGMTENSQYLSKIREILN